MRALLARTQIDEAFELRGEQLLAPVVAHADDLLDGRDADAGERELQRRQLALDVLYRDLGGPIFVHSGKDRCPFARPCAQKASRTAQGFSKTAGGFRATKQASAQGTTSGGAPMRTLLPGPERFKPRQWKESSTPT